MKDLMKVFKAVADETRMRIMKVLLERKNLCVCEIMQSLNITQTRVSKNLRILKEAGLVVDKKEGLWVHYSVAKNESKNIKKILIFLKQSLKGDKIVIKDKERLNKAVRLGKGYQTGGCR